MCRHGHGQQIERQTGDKLVNRIKAFLKIHTLGDEVTLYVLFRMQGKTLRLLNLKNTQKLLQNEFL